MKAQRRGKETQERILEEACRVFAEKGFRDATHAEICRRAGANVAAVNYYFSSKEALYVAAFERLNAIANERFPLDGGLPKTSPPEKRLRAFIHGQLRRMFDTEDMGAMHRIRMAELFDPTGLLSAPLAQELARNRAVILEILREMLGEAASQKTVEWCELSVVSQCFMGGPGPDDEGPRAIFGITGRDLDALTEHITAFSLGGIKAIKRKG